MRDMIIYYDCKTNELRWCAATRRGKEICLTHGVIDKPEPKSTDMDANK